MNIEKQIDNSVRVFVWESVWIPLNISTYDSVGASGASIGACVWDSVWETIGDAVDNDARKSVVTHIKEYEY